MAVTLSANEYRLLVQNSPVLIWRAGVDANCDYFNETWLAFTGRTLEEEQGEGWAAGVHPEDLDRCVKYYLDHFHRRQPFEMEYRLRRHDGVYRWIFDRGVPSYDEHGTFLGFIGSCVDIDERRHEQAAREKRDEEQLASARELERSILGIVGHDIRNPLATIAGSAQMLSLRIADPGLQKVVERIARGAARIGNIVADLLDLSRVRHGGGIPVSPAETDLRVICTQVIDELATTTNRTISFEPAGDASGVWDPNRITQALSNLVGNAVQHSPPGSHILVRARSDGDRMVAEVHNEGHIAADLLPNIFDPFRSGSSPSSREGLGLGLFIAKAIARAHHGSIEVESDAGRGTTFRLVLPRKVTHPARQRV